MSYPESIPEIRNKRDAKKFQSRLKHFKLTAKQRKLYSKADELAKQVVETS